MRTPFLRREAGSLINRTVIVRQPRSRHPRKPPRYASSIAGQLGTTRFVDLPHFQT
jgi:hypothetical protein